MKKILVTGCAGFIGYHVAYELLVKGEFVLGVDNLNDFYSRKLKHRNLSDLMNFQNFHFVKLDITNQQKLLQICEENKIEFIAHLAAQAGVRPSIENPFSYYHSNVLGTISVLEVAKKLNVKNTVITSSSSVYGNQKKIPFNELDKVDCQISPYAASKKACENLSYSYHYLHKLNINIVRPFTVYGQRSRPDMAISLFIEKIKKNVPIIKYGSGETVRDYTYITDFVNGFIAALEKPLGFEIFNLGNSEAVTLNKMIYLIENTLNKKALIKEMSSFNGDVDQTLANIDKAKKMLNYEPKIDLETGLKLIIQNSQKTAEK